MSCRWTQAACCFALSLATVAAFACAGAAAGEIDSPRARDACQSLVRDVIRRPYGVAWSLHAAEPQEDAAPPAFPQPRTARRGGATVDVSFQPLATPAATLLLLESGIQMQDATYSAAALDAARGMMAAQDPTGRIPALATFGRNAGGQDPPAAVPDRASTRAALAILLLMARQHALADSLPPADPNRAVPTRAARSAARAARWLFKQQTHAGGWPVAVPPDAAPGEGVKVLRLDTTDYRDSTLAMLLAAAQLEDQVLRRSADKSIEQLLQLRTTTVGRLGRGLWGTAYQLNGTIDFTAVPECDDVDMLATRNAMLTLLASHLLLGDDASLDALHKAAEAVERLRPENGSLWPRFPNRPPEQPAPSTTPTTRSIFPAERRAGPRPWVAMDDVLEAIANINRSGRETARDERARPLSVEAHVAAVLCGLVQDPFVPPRPMNRDSIERAPALQQRIVDGWEALTAYRPTTRDAVGQSSG